MPDGRPEEPHKTVQTVGGYGNGETVTTMYALVQSVLGQISSSKGKCSYVRAVERKLDVLFRGRREYPKETAAATAVLIVTGDFSSPVIQRSKLKHCRTVGAVQCLARRTRISIILRSCFAKF